jgi:hypothetical protein
LNTKAQSNCGHLRGFQETTGAVRLMQNVPVATYPDKSNPANRNPVARAAHDFFLDPLPVPDATESSTDTAWGLWEHTVQSYAESGQNLADAAQPGFEDTEVSALVPPPDES